MHNIFEGVNGGAAPERALALNVGVTLVSGCVLEMNVKSRRQAREVALQVLYQCDTLEDWSDEALDLCLSRFFAEDPPVDEDSRDLYRIYAIELVKGVRGKIKEIDERISAASENWSFSRMARVDRNILRIAVFEICFSAEVPDKVSINEAIEVARRFGARETPAFVNGILDRIAGAIREAA